MDSKKTKILLDKINALYKSISTDNKNVSTIEKDLMKSYIQQFYESFLDMPQTSSRSAVEVIKSTPKRTTTVIEKKAAPTPPPKPEAAPPKAQVEKVVPPPPPAPKVEKVEPPAPIPAPKPTSNPTPPPPKSASSIANPDMDDLFAINSAKELSEKLSEMPITDIKKSMGLNERILTLNELFGGDQGIFDLTLDTLNKLPNFDQAKLFLIQNAATKYNWTAKTRKGKAKDFIKLVKRRYN